MGTTRMHTRTNTHTSTSLPSVNICKAPQGNRPPLWSSGQSSCLQIQWPGFNSRHCQIFREVVGLEWRPLNLVSAIEELLERKSSGYGLENREYDRGDQLR
jgi:hypothetical protein